MPMQAKMHKGVTCSEKASWLKPLLSKDVSHWVVTFNALFEMQGIASQSKVGLELSMCQNVIGGHLHDPNQQFS